MSPDERAAYQLDESLLNPTNTKAINGLYGESGPVLLELLRRNPAVTIPVLVTRMEQKDAEWWVVRGGEGGSGRAGKERGGGEGRHGEGVEGQGCGGGAERGGQAVWYVGCAAAGGGGAGSQLNPHPLCPTLTPQAHHPPLRPHRYSPL